MIEPADMRTKGRALRRFLWRSAVCVSSVLLAFVLTVWVVTYNNQRLTHRTGPGYGVFFNRHHGWMSVGRTTWSPPTPRLDVPAYNGAPDYSYSARLFISDVSLTHIDVPGRDGGYVKIRQVSIDAQAWRLAVLSAILPTIAAGRRIGRRLTAARRARQGCCRRCGYDLRGSRESGRCPECGMAFNAAVTVPAASGTLPRADLRGS